MKNILKTALCCILCVICFTFTACSKKSNDNDSVNEEYYSALGYHKIEFDSYTNIVYDADDKVTISETKIMVPNNAEISLAFNAESNTSFTYNNGTYINFSEGVLLSGFKTEDTTYETTNTTIVVKDNLTVSAEFVNFKSIGIAIYLTTSKNEVVDIPSGKLEYLQIDANNPLYFKAPEVSINGFNQSTLLINNNSNTALKTKVTSIENNKFKVESKIEVYIETVTATVCLILTDKNSKIYLYKTDPITNIESSKTTFDNLSNKNSNLESLSVELSYDVSTTPEY